jgi:hypothetical protein
MAQLVGGVGASHSPQLSIPADGWRPHGDMDGERLKHLPPTRRDHDEIIGELDSDLLIKRYEECQVALEKTGAALADMRPDVLVVIGDDQRELFLDDIMPAISIFWGTTMFDRPPGADAYPPTMEVAYQYYHADEEDQYETNPALGLHIVESMVADEFDIAQFTQQHSERSLGHAFTFIYRRLLVGEPRLPLVPIFLNTYYPPNQPTPRRCIDMGRALGRAIRSWPTDLRVAVVASGGLTHPIVDEELDRRLLRGLETRDWDDLADLPQDALHEGTSEIRNWLMVGGALEEHTGQTVDYIPAYRSNVGSGCGMGFFTWTEDDK